MPINITKSDHSEWTVERLMAAEPPVNPSNKEKTWNLSLREVGRNKYGVFAEEKIKEGRRIGRYMGELRGKKDAEGEDDFFQVEVNDGEVVDGKQEGNIARFINDHRSFAGDENVRFYTYDKRISFKAHRTIQAGEQLLANFGETYPFPIPRARVRVIVDDEEQETDSEYEPPTPPRRRRRKRPLPEPTEPPILPPPVPPVPPPAPVPPTDAVPERLRQKMRMSSLMQDFQSEMLQKHYEQAERIIDQQLLLQRELYKSC